MGSPVTQAQSPNVLRCLRPRTVARAPVPQCHPSGPQHVSLSPQLLPSSPALPSFIHSVPFQALCPGLSLGASPLIPLSTHPDLCSALQSPALLQ